MELASMTLKIAVQPWRGESPRRSDRVVAIGRPCGELIGDCLARPEIDDQGRLVDR
jgi:hypothetical protein